MALATDIMRGGTSAGTALAINGQANTSITAGTTQTQAGGTSLTISTNVVTTVAVAGDGVTLPNAMVGDSVNILNLGANSCTVYPPVGGRINSLNTNGGFTLAPSTAVWVQKFTSTRWMAFLSA